MYVNVRCKEGTHLLCLTIDKINEIRAGDKKFDKKLMMYENMLLRKGYKIPLDCMISSNDQPHKFKELKQRKNLLKNVIMNRIVEIRIQHNKPKLGDFLKLLKAHGMPKEVLLQKLTMLYSDQPNVIEEDRKFDEINGYFDRMKKVF